MEYGNIEREIHVDAAPEVVFDVVTSPEHIREWWGGAEASFPLAAGATGELTWGDPASDGQVSPLTVVDVVPPRLFSFRWCYDRGALANATNSLLVTFELVPTGSGTTLRMTESGFREIGWEVAVLEASYQDHVNGWNTFVPNLRDYLGRLVAQP